MQGKLTIRTGQGKGRKGAKNKDKGDQVFHFELDTSVESLIMTLLSTGNSYLIGRFSQRYVRDKQKDFLTIKQFPTSEQIQDECNDDF